MDFLNKNFSNEEVVEISQANIQAHWKTYMPSGSYAALEAEQVFEKAFLQYVGQSQEATELAFLKGGWTFNLKGGLVKTALSGAFMTGLFCWMGFESINVAVLPSVLPFLFELDKIELSQKEETILAQLLVKEEVKQRLHSPVELYKMLPAATRKMLNELDFQDFLEKLNLAGHLKKKKIDLYQLSETQRFKITFV